MPSLIVPRRQAYPPSKRPRHSPFRNRQADSGEAFQHLINVSGGKDSTAVYLLALEAGRPFRAVFADTGHEHELTYDFISRLSERTGGPPIEIVRADFSARLARHRDYILREWPKQGVPDAIVAEAAALNVPTGIPFLDLCICKGRFPSRMAQFCSEELKSLPITLQVVFPMLRNGPVLQWLGIRAAESSNRAKLPFWNRHDSGCMLWRPIFHWSVDDVWSMHRRHGLAPNPLYALGMGRVGCMPCINCRKNELREIASRFPEHIERVARWEAIVSAANKRRVSTFFAALKDPMDVDRPGTYAGIHTVVEWSRTSRGGRQYELFFDGQAGSGCNSDLALCEWDEALPHTLDLAALAPSAS
ncbi:phosphoadenosine phosphosulfate reductase family protein [Shinella sp.]|uniref:phosphoadenosine phosphosulfate reductase family protein n=1 Tax=Shinella sp. TaxID=1870904 RepID=UPI0025835830|nr:phosphoadenosine phosphosulfate reductase family protein [Shinella sp.]MCW5712328.1 phosphoadenosine phosphosulfate reductase family protein [Shinella sp.]